MVIFLLILGLSLAFIGSVLLAKPLIKSEELIRQISTYTDTDRARLTGEDEDGKKKRINEELKNSLEEENRWGILGIFFLAAGFFLQILYVILRYYLI